MSCPSAHYDSHFYDMADNRRADAAGRMLNIEGETRTCRIKLGGLVHVIFPQKMNVPALGIYRITQLNHYIDKNGNYSNRFFAMPNKYEYVPERFEHKRIAYPEVATVLDNNDPRKQGRVQVEFYWQKPKHLNTNWLRVQTPDAGSSDKVSTNRGFVSIPEIGDQVMVGFEHGDPHRPFVMGSMFHGKIGQGGYDENHLKSISTRSGHHVVFDDNEKGDWSITIKDRNGNIINLNTAQKAINISSVEEINLTSKNIKLEAGENITVIAGKNYTSTIEGEYSNDVKGNHTEIIEKDKKTSVSGKSTLDIAKDLDLSIAKNMDLEIGNKANAKTGGKANIHADGKMDITSNVIVHVAKK